MVKSPLPDEITFVSRFEVEVYYEDTDLSGFVYHANYFKFFERAREHAIGREFLREMLGNGMHFVVSQAKIKYLFPAQFGDRLLIISKACISHSPAVEFKQTVFNAANPKKPIVEADVTLVVLNKQNRPIRMPDELFHHFYSIGLTGNICE